MMVVMFKFLALGALFVPVIVVAAGVSVVDPDESKLITLDTISDEQIFYGELVGAPHTFYFALDEPTVLKSQVVVTDEGHTDVSSIVIKDKRRGVTEIARRTGRDVVWEPYRDSLLNYTFMAAPTLEAELDQGTYRLEVSSPDNIGSYRLQLGTVPVRLGYSESLSAIYTGYSFIGSPWGVLRTPHYYGLFIVIMLIGGWLWYRQKKNHA